MDEGAFAPSKIRIGMNSTTSRKSSLGLVGKLNLMCLCSCRIWNEKNVFNNQPSGCVTENGGSGMCNISIVAFAVEANLWCRTQKHSAAIYCIVAHLVYLPKNWAQILDEVWVCFEDLKQEVADIQVSFDYVCRSNGWARQRSKGNAWSLGSETLGTCCQLGSSVWLMWVGPMPWNGIW